MIGRAQSVVVGRSARSRACVAHACGERGVCARFLTRCAPRAPGGQCKRIEKRVFPKHESMFDTFDKELRKSNTAMAYAKAGGEAVGYIVFVRDGDTGKIIKLCVVPHQRRRGIGAALLDMALCELGVPPRAKGGASVTGAGAGGGGRRVKGPTRPKGGLGGLGGLSSSSKTPEARPPALVQLHVDPERVGALRLYQSRGFAEVRRVVDYYCEGRDALYCELRVGSSFYMV